MSRSSVWGGIVRGSDLRNWRNKYGIPGDELAKTMGMHEQSLWRMERKDTELPELYVRAWERASMILAISNDRIRVCVPEVTADCAQIHVMVQHHLKAIADGNGSGT